MDENEGKIMTLFHENGSITVFDFTNEVGISFA
jgi:hypothetical protein